MKRMWIAFVLMLIFLGGNSAASACYRSYGYGSFAFSQGYSFPMFSTGFQAYNVPLMPISTGLSTTSNYSLTPTFFSFQPVCFCQQQSYFMPSYGFPQGGYMPPVTLPEYAPSYSYGSSSAGFSGMGYSMPVETYAVPFFFNNYGGYGFNRGYSFGRGFSRSDFDFRQDFRFRSNFSFQQDFRSNFNFRSGGSFSSGGRGRLGLLSRFGRRGANEGSESFRSNTVIRERSRESFRIH